MPHQTQSHSRSWSMLSHLTAGTLALWYAWGISSTSYVTTGVQFVSPLVVIVAVHLAWLSALGRLQPGFAMPTLARTVVTATGIAAATVLAANFEPSPALAEPEWQAILGGIVGAIGCLMVLALVVGIAAGVVYLVAMGLYGSYVLVRRLFKRPPGAGDSRLFDFGAVAVAFLAIGTASLEGVTGAFSFAASDGASRTFAVAAIPARVWAEVGVATSPSFPLPMMLQSIPQPIAVLVDEGADVGARRIVQFKGREGVGELALQVVRRTEREAVFAVISDSSPISMWVRQKSLTFRVEPQGTGTLLTVSSDYDRLLAPAWFFGPYIRAASYLAVDVLARDTKARAERP